MWLDNSSQDAVRLFWELCGETERFPRNLERPISLGLPVVLVKLPRLTVSEVEEWLRKRGRVFRFGCESRPIRGCLIGYKGWGLIFVDGADPDDERRFTLAHEVAHFLMDYWLPRQAAVQKIGQSVTEVLDGMRKPTVSEEVHGLLARASVELYADLMERDEIDGSANSEVWRIEDRADRVALALLAPPDAVLAERGVSASRFEERRSAVSSALCSRFGLPASIAASYSWALLADAGLGPSWVEGISEQ